MGRIPLTRLALARMFVNLAMLVLPPNNWAFERLYWVSDSLKRQYLALAEGKEG